MGKASVLFIGVFGLVGLGLLAGASFAVYSLLEFRAGAVTAPGTVVGLEGGRPVVEFVDLEGEARRVGGQVSSQPPAYHRGESVTVRYSPGEPAAARIDGFLESWFAPVLLGGMGSVFAGIAGGLLISERRKRRLHDWLQQFGTRIEAKYTGVRLDTTLRINGQHPWRLMAQWQNPATGLVHTFESETLFYDPSDYVKLETLGVWIDPSDPRRHHLDTGFLPKLASD